MRKVLVLPDPHVPYHNREALSLALRAGADCDTVILLGDFLDVYGLSRFNKFPGKSEYLKDEIDQGYKVLRWIESKLPNTDRVYLEGNHEHRITKEIWNNHHALQGMVNLKDLLGLTQHGWKWIPYGDYHKIGKLLFTHEGSGGRYFSALAAQRYGISVCVGHHHKIQYVEKQTLAGRMAGFSPGCLCDIQAVGEYVPHKAKDWHLGFAIVNVLGDGEWFHEIFPIINGKTCVAGRLLRSDN